MLSIGTKRRAVSEEEIPGLFPSEDGDGLQRIEAIGAFELALEAIVDFRTEGIFGDTMSVERFGLELDNSSQH